MEFEFGPAKDEANIAKHGLSLSEAIDINLEAAVVVEDDREDHGETRYRAFWRIGEEGRCLAFTIRGSTLRAISLRRAHDKELRRYGR